MREHLARLDSTLVDLLNQFRSDKATQQKHFAGLQTRVRQAEDLAEGAAHTQQRQDEELRSQRARIEEITFEMSSRTPTFDSPRALPSTSVPPRIDKELTSLRIRLGDLETKLGGGEEDPYCPKVVVIDRLDELERLQSEASERHSRELKALKESYDKYLKGLHEVKLKVAQTASLPEHVEYLEQQVEESRCKHWQEIQALQAIAQRIETANERHAQDMGEVRVRLEAVAAIEARFGELSRSSGSDSAAGRRELREIRDEQERQAGVLATHQESLASLPERVGVLERCIGDSADRRSIEGELRLLHDASERSVAEAQAAQAAIAARLEHLEVEVANASARQARELRQLGTFEQGHSRLSERLQSLERMMSDVGQDLASVREGQAKLALAHDGQVKELSALRDAHFQVYSTHASQQTKAELIAALAAARAELEKLEVEMKDGPGVRALQSAAAALEERLEAVERRVDDASDRNVTELQALTEVQTKLAFDLTAIKVAQGNQLKHLEALQQAHDNSLSNLAGMKMTHAQNASLPQRIDSVERQVSDSVRAITSNARDLEELRRGHADAVAQHGRLEKELAELRKWRAEHAGAGAPGDRMKALEGRQRELTVTFEMALEAAAERQALDARNNKEEFRTLNEAIERLGVADTGLDGRLLGVERAQRDATSTRILDDLKADMREISERCSPLAMRVDYLEQSLADSADRYTADLRELKDAVAVIHNLHGQSSEVARSSQARIASVEDRLGQLDGARAAAAIAAEGRDAVLTKQTADTADRVTFIEQLLGESLERRKEERSAILRPASPRTQPIGFVERADRLAKELQALKEAQDRQKRELKATVEDRLQALEDSLDESSQKYVVELQALRDAQTGTASELEAMRGAHRGLTSLPERLESLLGTVADAKDLQALKEAHSKIATAHREQKKELAGLKDLPAQLRRLQRFVGDVPPSPDASPAASQVGDASPRTPRLPRRSNSPAVPAADVVPPGDSLRDRLAGLERSLAEAERVRAQELKDLRDSRERHAGELASIPHRIGALERKLSDAAEASTQERIDVREELGKVLGAVDALEAAQTSWTSRLDTLSLDGTSLRSSRDRLSAEVAELRSYQDECSRSLRDLRDIGGASSGDVAALSERVERLEQTQSDAAIQQAEELRALSEAQARFASAHSKLDRELELLQEDVRAALATQGALPARIEELERSVGELSERRRDDLRQLSERQASTRGESDQRVEALRQELRSAVTSQSTLLERFAELEGRQREAAEAHALEQLRAKLPERIAELERRQREAAECHAAELRAKLPERIAELERRQREAAEAHAAEQLRAKLPERIAELERRQREAAEAHAAEQLRAQLPERIAELERRQREAADGHAAELTAMSQAQAAAQSEYDRRLESLRQDLRSAVAQQAELPARLSQIDRAHGHAADRYAEELSALREEQAAVHNDFDRRLDTLREDVRAAVTNQVALPDRIARLERLQGLQGERFSEELRTLSEAQAGVHAEHDRRLESLRDVHAASRTATKDRLDRLERFVGSSAVRAGSQDAPASGGERSGAALAAAVCGASLSDRLGRLERDVAGEAAESRAARDAARTFAGDVAEVRADIAALRGEALLPLRRLEQQALDSRRESPLRAGAAGMERRGEFHDELLRVREQQTTLLERLHYLERSVGDSADAGAWQEPVAVSSVSPRKPLSARRAGSIRERLACLECVLGDQLVALQASHSEHVRFTEDRLARLEDLLGEPRDGHQIPLAERLELVERRLGAADVAAPSRGSPEIGHTPQTLCTPRGRSNVYEQLAAVQKQCERFDDALAEAREVRAGLAAEKAARESWHCMLEQRLESLERGLEGSANIKVVLDGLHVCRTQARESREHVEKSLDDVVRRLDQLESAERLSLGSGAQGLEGRLRRLKDDVIGVRASHDTLERRLIERHERLERLFEAWAGGARDELASLAHKLASQARAEAQSLLMAGRGGPSLADDEDAAAEDLGRAWIPTESQPGPWVSTAADVAAAIGAAAAPLDVHGVPSARWSPSQPGAAEDAGGQHGERTGGSAG